ncbi:MAG: hypothetical protein IJ089_11240 [Clostridia bacterium]|nr:hypothetical protein [Clostridia bacterium]
MKKWIAAILTLVMLAQALPCAAFADTVAAGQLIPVRSKTDKPIITGQEPKNPLNSFMEGGFGLNFHDPEARRQAQPVAAL